MLSGYYPLGSQLTDPVVLRVHEDGTPWWRWGWWYLLWNVSLPRLSRCLNQAELGILADTSFLQQLRWYRLLRMLRVLLLDTSPMKCYTSIDWLNALEWDLAYANTESYTGHQFGAIIYCRWICLQLIICVLSRSLVGCQVDHAP